MSRLIARETWRHGAREETPSFESGGESGQSRCWGVPPPSGAATRGRLALGVVVHSMDRLACNLGDLRRSMQKLTARGVHIEFVKEHLAFTGEDPRRCSKRYHNAVSRRCFLLRGSMGMAVGIPDGSGKVERDAGVLSTTSSSWDPRGRGGRCWPAGSPPSGRT
jgi:hypothetical protein